MNHRKVADEYDVPSPSGRGQKIGELAVARDEGGGG